MPQGRLVCISCRGQCQQCVERQFQAWQLQQRQSLQYQCGALRAPRIMYDFHMLYDAYIACRRGKRTTQNALAFEVALIDHLTSLERELYTRSYRPSPSIAFVTTSPKLREVFAADFRDRVVHHVLVPLLDKIFEPVFIHDSYSARKTKGIHAARYRAQSFAQARPYYLQLDIKNFFYSIDKTILMQRITQVVSGRFTRTFENPHVTQEELLWLCERIIWHDVTRDARVKSSWQHRQLPPHKTLFKIAKNRGLPIGNLTSQFFANVYLDLLDQFCKRELKCRYYLRYVDDFVIFGENIEQLQAKKDKIATFLSSVLALELRDRYVLRPCSEGLDFLGYIIRPHYTLVRQRVVRNFAYKKGRFLSAYEGAQGRMPLAPIEKFAAVRASFLAHIKHANSYTLSQTLGAIYETNPFDFDRDTDTPRRHEP